MARSDSSAGSVGDRLARIGYRRARQLLAVTGIGILAVLIAVLIVRSVDTTEVVATLLYAPIFVLLLYFGLPGGLVGAAGATAVYVVLRTDAVDAVGWGEFAGLITSRAVAYTLFGAVGGWASQTLEMSLDKLDLYDQVDDQTGLFNARCLLGDIDTEKARSQRYQTVFSVSFLDLDAASLDHLPARRRRSLLRELGRKLADGVRTMDRVAHGFDGTTHHLAVILPETATGGAGIFHDRLIESIRAFLIEQGAGSSLQLRGSVVTVPGDDEALAERLALWATIDDAEHAAPRADLT